MYGYIPQLRQIHFLAKKDAFGRYLFTTKMLKKLVCHDIMLVCATLYMMHNECNIKCKY